MRLSTIGLLLLPVTISAVLTTANDNESDVQADQHDPFRALRGRPTSRGAFTPAAAAAADGPHGGTSSFMLTKLLRDAMDRQDDSVTDSFSQRLLIEETTKSIASLLEEKEESGAIVNLIKQGLMEFQETILEAADHADESQDVSQRGALVEKVMSTLVSLLENESDTMTGSLEESMGHIRRSLLQGHEEHLNGSDFSQRRLAMEDVAKSLVTALDEKSDATASSVKQNMRLLLETILKRADDDVKSSALGVEKSVSKLHSIFVNDDDEKLDTAARELVAIMDDDMFSKTLLTDMIMDISTALETGNGLEGFSSEAAIKMEEYLKSSPELSTLYNDAIAEVKGLLGGDVEAQQIIGIIILLPIIALVVAIVLVIILIPLLIIAIPIIIFFAIITAPIWVPILIASSIYVYLICPVFDNDLPNCDKFDDKFEEEEDETLF